MPVPVPRVIKPIAHPVVKSTRGIGRTTNPILPIEPIGPPPSFGTREEWINSLPSWRRTKPRRIWEEDSHSEGQGFHQGLTVADNAMVIKGARADACIPPMSCDPVHYDRLQEEYAETTISHAGLSAHAHPHEGSADWFKYTSTDIDDMMDVEEDPAAVGTSPNLVFTDLATYESQTYNHRGVFTPVLEDQSPSVDSGPDSGSSPLEPLTPFTNFVDRAVAAEQPRVSGKDDHTFINTAAETGIFKEGKNLNETAAAPVFPTLAEPAKESVPAADVVIPTATSGYKNLAGPLSEWLANYVWKVCTTGLSLPPAFAYASPRAVQYSANPPGYLAPSIHSLLLSTLLQPSAVYLAVWYIVRLPVYFNAADMGADYVKEMHFRRALLGETYNYERENLELNAPFRLVVLGCMLANKWLDDHTFSNKTWHTISNVPIQMLNRLETLVLDMFSYDLSISNRDWSQWMAHVKAYHMSLASTHLQPISRPSSNPHSIIRKSMDEIIEASSLFDSQTAFPKPVFLGIEERKKSSEQAAPIDILEIDLDEDGPLREEYLPKRRSNAANSVRGNNSGNPQNLETAKTLPPPAKWSPAGDEPILRDRNRSSGHYVAVQPTQPYPYSVPYCGPDVVYTQAWDGSFGVSSKGYNPYSYGHPTLPVHPAPYNPYPQQSLVPMSHSRSQSMFYDSDNMFSRTHSRSYSQTCFDYNKCMDSRIPRHDPLASFQPEPKWVEPNPYIYCGSAYAPAFTVASNHAWLRT